ncbi:PREDICTED: death-associated protein-like 1 [Mesitornis unicolor]|uniref:death-associated protein-like 1 n=1 Tax=Mesitornis unicolor TaxID=54374 RepID=UPI0005284A2F|nr:PREDICTED: death-associated protein-like 1 [Mesitornis unicolor]
MAEGEVLFLRLSLQPVKAGGMRVSKKHENGLVEKNAKPPGKDKTRAIASFSRTRNMGVLVAEALSKVSHKIHAAALQVAHQKPRPALEKIILPKRMYIIQQPRKC